MFYNHFVASLSQYYIGFFIIALIHIWNSLSSYFQFKSILTKSHNPLVKKKSYLLYFLIS